MGQNYGFRDRKLKTSDQKAKSHSLPKHKNCSREIEQLNEIDMSVSRICR
ncbi:hypothetical protein [Sphingobacterium faecale]|uniref:Uncharacterized protein n=1 Tax=Sphingobacterium faecale TaxID=2803775 RepID=A0ABS1R178_9SPHI|nr:hypothetical protein [Sphingobacterium faecale]MBL1408055.1 hypothetical protein [Sphingobacterium faecale]